MAKCYVRGKQDGDRLCLPEAGVRRYSFTQPDGAEPRRRSSDGYEVDAVGEGAFGIVVRATDPLGIPRAIKLIDKADTVGPLADYKTEIRLANAKPFRNVVNIIDYDLATDIEGREFPFYVSPFIDGITVKELLSTLRNRYERIADNIVTRRRLHDLAVRLALDILDGLVELSTANVVHMDLSTNNLLVHPRTGDPLSLIEQPTEEGQSAAARQAAIIIDLGAAKLIRTGDRGTWPLVCTKYYFPMDRLPELCAPSHSRSPSTVESGRLGTLSREAVAKCWEEIDLFSLGRIFEEAFFDRVRRKTRQGFRATEELRRTEKRKEEFWAMIFGDDFRLLEGIVDNLHNRPWPYPRYKSATEAREAVRALPLRQSTGVLSSDVLTDRYAGRRIRVGTTLVRVSLPFDSLIDHPTFQRLKRIQQLAFVSEVFPDGTHTRFTHSLKVFELAKQFVLSLNRNTEFRLIFDRVATEQFLAAALLHDLGQYHFSHSIEDLKKAGDRRGIPKLAEIEHDQDLLSKNLAIPDQNGRTMEQILEAHGLNVDAITYMVRKTEKDGRRSAVENLGRDLIAGSIDVDRASYLRHDSERTGVPYGAAADVGGLIESLLIRWEPDGDGQGIVGLGVEEGGVSAAEGVLTAVYWMYRNVYWRHTNRAFMAAVKHVMLDLLVRTEYSFEQYLRETWAVDDLRALEVLRERHDAYLQGKLRAGGPEETNPLSSLADLRRIGYSRLYSLRANDGDLFYRLVLAVLEQKPDTAKDNFPEEYLAQYVGLRFFGKSHRRGDILVDVPMKDRLKGRVGREDATSREAGDSEVWVRLRRPLTREHVDWMTLAQYSPLAEHLGQIELTSSRKIRVFISRRLLESVNKNELCRAQDEMYHVLGEGLDDWLEGGTSEKTTEPLRERR